MAQEPDAIREEIEDTRERMSETVGALSYKTDVKSRMKNAVSSQKDKLMGTVSDNTPDPGQVKEKAKQGVGIVRRTRSHSPSVALRSASSVVYLHPPRAWRTRGSVTFPTR